MSLQTMHSEQRWVVLRTPNCLHGSNTDSPSVGLNSYRPFVFLLCSALRKVRPRDWLESRTQPPHPQGEGTSSSSRILCKVMQIPRVDISRRLEKGSLPHASQTVSNVELTYRNQCCKVH